jgi:hypothetical protein
MLQLGFATRDITPSRPAMIQGQKGRRIGHEALDPITVTAWAMTNEDNSEATVLVSCDITTPSQGLIEHVRGRIDASSLPIDGAAVILTATHTHTSLVHEDGSYEFPGGDVMTPMESEAWLTDQITEAIEAAWEARTPRIVARAFEHAVVGHNRYAVYADGNGQMYGKTRRDDFAHIGGYEDHSIDLMFAWNPDGTLAGVAIVIPCPSQVTEHLTQFSADYWHEVRVELRKRLGGQHADSGNELSVLGLCGNAGDQSPHFLLYGEQEEEMRQRRGVSEREEIGRRVGEAVERALACTPPDADRPCSLTHHTRHLKLAPRSISQAERDQAESLYEEAVAQGDTETWWPKRQKAVVEIFDGIREAELVPVEVHGIRIGDFVMATNPFELFLDYGLQIKARSCAAQTMLVQLAGRGFYLPSPRAVAAGGYGAMPAVSAAGPEAGAELVEETLSMIDALMRDA